MERGEKRRACAAACLQTALDKQTQTTPAVMEEEQDMSSACENQCKNAKGGYLACVVACVVKEDERRND